MRKRKELARRELVPVSEAEFEVNADDFFESALDIPQRPPWNFDMSREELEAREHRYFTVSYRASCRLEKSKISMEFG